MGMDVFLVLMNADDRLVAGQMLRSKLLCDLQRQFRGDLAGLEGLDDVIILDAICLTIVLLGFHHTADGMFGGAALAGSQDLFICFAPIEDIPDSHVQPALAGEDFRNRHYRSATLSMSYYMATLLSTLIICFVAAGICLVYVAVTGWYMSLADVFLLLLDILLLVLLGTAFSSIVNFFLSTQGQISAVGTIISAGYGFICGAYMPISSFSEGLQEAVAFLPGTYGTALVRNHAMQGVLAEMEGQGVPEEVIEGMRDLLDCNIYFFEKQVDVPVMYAILIAAIALLVVVYIMLNVFRKRRG